MSRKWNIGQESRQHHDTIQSVPNPVRRRQDEDQNKPYRCAIRDYRPRTLAQLNWTIYDTNKNLEKPLKYLVLYADDCFAVLSIIEFAQIYASCDGIAKEKFDNLVLA